MLRNFPAITDSYERLTRKKLPFGEAILNFQSALVDFAASEEESNLRNESNGEEKNMKSHISQIVQIQAAEISAVSVRLISLILVLLGIVLLIANGGPP